MKRPAPTPGGGRVVTTAALAASRPRTAGRSGDERPSARRGSGGPAAERRCDRVTCEVPEQERKEGGRKGTRLAAAALDEGGPRPLRLDRKAPTTGSVL